MYCFMGLYRGPVLWNGLIVGSRAHEGRNVKIKFGQEWNTGTYVGEATINFSHLHSHQFPGLPQLQTLQSIKNKSPCYTWFPRRGWQRNDMLGIVLPSLWQPRELSPWWEAHVCNTEDGRAPAPEFAPLEQLCFVLEYFEDSCSYRDCRL